MIYFIKDSVTQEIKIGYSKRPINRVGDLQTGNPRKLILLGHVTGKKTDEGTFHGRFAQHRLEGGEWFKGEIIEEILGIIDAHKQHRLEIRRRTMTEMMPESEKVEVEPEPSGENGTLDKDSGILGVCRIPGLRLKSFSLKLTERPFESESEFQERCKELEATLKNQGQKGGNIESLLDNMRQEHERNKARVFCGFVLKYLLEFETTVTNDNATSSTSGDLQKLQQAIMAAGYQNKGLWHMFYDEDNAVIPFRPASNECNVIGGADGITGYQGETFKVAILFEKMLDRNYPGAKIKDVFMGENYSGEHPLKMAKKLVVSVR